jgi:PTH1 family peptidyl-tRNA hydrolase
MLIMILIVGLGNPGSQYEKTRHNIGFRVIDKLSELHNIPLNQKKHKAILGSGYIEGQKVILAQPQTYMNNSGESVREIADFFKIDPEDVLVVFDDISLAVGQLRLRKKGSAGGHNGIKSIISHLNSQDFPRVKVGVGEKPAGWDLADHVLAPFPKNEAEQVENAIKDAAAAVKMILTDSMESAMNVYNQKKS